jgi:hypothetical protein
MQQKSTEDRKRKLSETTFLGSETFDEQPKRFKSGLSTNLNDSTTFDEVLLKYISSLLAHDDQELVGGKISELELKVLNRAEKRMFQF